MTVLTNDPRPFAGSVNMSLFASGQKQQLNNLRLTITPSSPALCRPPRAAKSTKSSSRP